MIAGSPSAPEEPITVREVLRLLWEADHYPILGNEDARTAELLERDAHAKAACAIPLPDDPPEFAQWLACLRNPRLPTNVREEILAALARAFRR